MAGESLLEKKFNQLGLEATPEEFIEGLPAPVKRRVEFLQGLQDKHEEIEAQFRKERAALEAKYELLYGPLYAERQEVVSGAKVVPKKEGEADDAIPDSGIPEFWLTVLMKCDATADLIKEKDVDVLTYLTNITAESTHTEEGATNGFKLRFEFKENPYFANKALEKAYQLSPEDEGVLEKAIGTTIEWKAGKDVTIKIMKKKPKKGGKPDSKPQIKTERVDSFFNFFSPPDLPGEDDEIEEEQMEELQMMVESDYEVGATIREKLVPNAIRWYTGEAVEDEPMEYGGDYEGEDDEDEDDEDDDDDEDDSPPKGKPGKGKGGGKAPSAAPAVPDAQNPDCKQQ